MIIITIIIIIIIIIIISYFIPTIFEDKKNTVFRLLTGDSFQQLVSDHDCGPMFHINASTRTCCMNRQLIANSYARRVR